MIVEEVIEAQIGLLMDKTTKMNPDQAKEEFKKGLAKIIADAIKSATITVSAGIPVTVAVISVGAPAVGATTSPTTALIS